VFLGNFVLWPKWQLFTTRFSQIWLQGKYESNEKIKILPYFWLIYFETWRLKKRLVEF